MSEPTQQYFPRLERRRSEHDVLRRIIIAGEWMAHRLRQVADELDEAEGVSTDRPERRLPETFEALIEELRNADQSLDRA